MHKQAAGANRATLAPSKATPHQLKAAERAADSNAAASTGSWMSARVALRRGLGQAKITMAAAKLERAVSQRLSQRRRRRVFRARQQQDLTH